MAFKKRDVLRKLVLMCQSKFIFTLMYTFLLVINELFS